MPKQWRSIFEKWSCFDYKNLGKVRGKMQHLTEKKDTKATDREMAQLPAEESVTSLYTSFPSQENITEIYSNKSPASNACTVSNPNENAEIRIDLHSLVNNETRIIKRDSFKIKITKQENQDDADPELIKLKIVVPKGCTYNYNDGDHQKSTVERARPFQPEDFSAVSNDFAAFANSLLNVGSIEFNADHFVSSSPVPEEEEESSHYVTCVQQKSQISAKEETLNNTLDLSKDKEVKPFEFINNSDAEERSFQAVIEAKENDLKKDYTYVMNLKNERSSGFPTAFADLTRHSVETCDCKYLKPQQSFIVHPLKSEFGLEDQKDPKEFARPIHSVPIMGKNALFAKSNVVKEKLHAIANQDSEIIQQLVTQRFNSFLAEYRQRSLKRKSIRQKRFISDEEDADSSSEEDIPPLRIAIVKSEADPILNKKPESISDKGFESGDSSPKICNQEPNIEISPASSPSSSPDADTGSLKQPPILFRATSCENLNFKVNECEPQCLSAEEWTDYNSSITSCQSRNFGELLDSYDPRKFLIDALGKELDLSDTVFEEDFYPHGECVNRMISQDYSVSTSEISALISAHSTYSGLTEKRPKSQKSLKENTIDEEQSDMSSLTYVAEIEQEDDEVSELMREAAIQYQIMQQTDKALSVCRTIKEFEASPEQLEAERILLTATCQREVILQKLHAIRQEPKVPIRHPGSIRLNNFRFFTKSSACDSKDALKRAKDHTQWFVCIVSCDTKLFATDATIADFNGDVTINSEICFDNLGPDFKVTIAIYSMTVKHSLRNYSHESKYHLNTGSKTKCPSPTKLFNFRRRETPSIPTGYLGVKPSNFTLWGTASIGITDLDKTSFQIRDAPRCSTLSKDFSVAIDSWVHINEEYAGFLNVGTSQSDNNGPFSWNKRWCSLHDSELRFWRDPCANGDPLQVIDLRLCVNSWISHADRTICARPRSLLLETRGDNDRIVSMILQADTTNDMKEWQQALNSVISSLKMWHSNQHSVSLDESAL